MGIVLEHHVLKMMLADPVPYNKNPWVDHSASVDQKMKENNIIFS